MPGQFGPVFKQHVDSVGEKTQVLRSDHSKSEFSAWLMTSSGNLERFLSFSKPQFLLRRVVVKTLYVGYCKNIICV